TRAAYHRLLGIQVVAQRRLIQGDRILRTAGKRVVENQVRLIPIQADVLGRLDLGTAPRTVPQADLVDLGRQTPADLQPGRRGAYVAEQRGPVYLEPVAVELDPLPDRIGHQ